MGSKVNKEIEIEDDEDDEEFLQELSNLDDPL
jgi:hypothetical protein